MKRFFFITLFSLTGLMVSAQSSMTDEQVKKYIITEYQNGASEKEIASELISKGATIAQIQKAKNDLEKLQKQQKPVAQGTQDSRLRKPFEGDKKELTEEELLMFEEDKDVSEDAKKIFGRDVFSNKELNFVSEINIATPHDYTIGVGDGVIIDVWGASQKTFNNTVSPEGEIVIEGCGPISLMGLTVEQANRKVKSVLGQYYANSNIKLSIGQTKTITVNVMGEVEQPGTYTMSAFSTVFHALYLAGGTTEIGTLRTIKVYRKNKLITTVDIYDYLLNGKLSGNCRLQSDDVIIVGTYENLVQAEGMLKRPMYYEMKSEESAVDLLTYAGGFTDNASTEFVRVTRKVNGKLSIFTLDEAQRGTFGLKDGDVLTVDSVYMRYNNMVAIRGAVKQPGQYQMGGSIQTLKQLIEAAGGLTEYALTGRALLHRRKADRTIETAAINLEQLMEGGVTDVVLQNEDELYIHSRESEMDNYELYIYGEIVTPGAYDYAENMTVEDLILTAGGLNDAASLTRVDVARRIRDKVSEKTEEVVSETFTFTLKDGFVVDGKADFTLLPFDEVFVRRAPNYIVQQHVLITGEAVFPGTYAISKRNYRLSDLIKAAGGLAVGAYADGARLERKLTKEELQQQRDMLKAINDSVDIEKLNLSATKFVGINLKQALEHPGNDFYDVVLQEGDVLNIPQMNNTITIRGEVFYPNTVVYQDGMKLKDYIEQAGGYTDKAKKSKVFAVNMDGTVTMVKKAKDIRPGAQIVVPTKEEREKLNFTQYISIFSTIAMMGSVIATLLK